ncbi:MAG: WbuC family cupin fold metalloprotein [Gallionella sp.]|nr:WbuC family cupin fold metalloprotein [Gallionella sp.]
MNGKYIFQNPEVLYSEAALTTVNQSDIEHFKQLSSRNPRKRIRLCTHNSPDGRLHEMLVVHDRSAYVRPHKHLGKTESTHIVEGLVDIVLFDDDGQITSVISMGDYASGRTFYFRMELPVFHTLIIRSDVLVFHETTNGPFDRRNTIFAPWAPEDGDVNFVSTFMATLDDRVRLIQ